MRALKLALIVLGGLIGVLVIGAITIVLLIDPNDYRGEIEKRVAAATGRPLHIGGKLDLKIFPWIALQVEGVALGNPPAYGTTPFLTVKRANVGVKLMPLLHKEVEVRRISLEGLAVHLVSRSDEDNNWKDLGKSDTKDNAAPASARTSVAGIDIKDALLEFSDESQKSLTRLTHLNLTSGALGSDAPVPVKLDFDYDDGTPGSAMHIGVKTSARVPADSSRIELRDLDLQGKAGQDGTAFTVRAPVLALDWKAETLAPASLSIQYGALPLKVTASGEKVLSNRVITGTIDVPRVSPRDLMKSMKMDAPKARDPRALTALAVKSRYRLTEKTLQLSQLAIDLDDSHIRGQLGIDDLDTHSLSFDLGIDTLNVDRYREPEPKPDGPNTSTPPTDLPRDGLRALNARGQLRIAQLTVWDLKLTDMLLPVDAGHGLVKLTPQAKLFAGRYEGDLQLDARGEKLKMATTGRLRGVDVGGIANAAFKSKRLTGAGDANIVLNGSGNTDAQMLKSLAGKFDLNVRDGAVNGVDLWYELRRAVALLKGGAAPARAEPVRTAFKTMTGNGTLAAGVIRDEDLRVDMDYLKARGSGTLGLETQAVNYRLVAEVYKLPASGAGSEMADVKALEIPIAVTGTLADMKIRPDVGDLLKARARKELDKHKDVLKKKLDSKLKSLFNH